MATLLDEIRSPQAAAALTALTLALACGGGGGSDSGPTPDPPLHVDLAGFPTTAGLARVLGSVGTGAFGVPVAGGLDSNDDGFPDFAVAAMLADPNGRTDAGLVFLVFGDGTVSGSIDTALASTRVLEIWGAATSEHTGSEIWLDDVTGDGLADLLIARQDHTPSAGRSGAGALSIVVGGEGLSDLADALAPLDLAAPAVGVTVTTLVGADAHDRLGIWMRTGDVTGDGIADLVVGADQESRPGEFRSGAIYVIRGGPELAAGGTVDLADFGATALAGHVARITPPPGATRFHFGATCQIADLDGNGRAEVLAAAALNRAGASLLPAGSAPGASEGTGGSTDGTLYIVWDDNFPAGEWDDGFSFSVDGAPDDVTIVDGGTRNVAFGEEILGGLDYDDDGNADLFVGDIVGDLSGARNRSGSGHVLYDAASLRGLSFDLDSPPAGLRTTVFLGASANNIAGDTATHGDYDGDGIDDLVFTSPHSSANRRRDAGIVHVVYGQVGPWPTTVDLRHANLPAPSELRYVEVWGARGTAGFDSGDVLGYSAATGDIDGDGQDDLIVNEMLGNGATPAARDTGNLIVVSGTTLDAAVP
ncbi:MAG: hypothetical protein MJE66_05545 [Proteobacteria bacterium]|nr:hypothetical protein [Pseudomonadota bacterium]